MEPRPKGAVVFQSRDREGADVLRFLLLADLSRFDRGDIKVGSSLPTRAGARTTYRCLQDG